MANPWLDIPLADYEAHMALPTVGRARLIADELDNLVRSHSPASVAIIGCAGGNGFDCLADTTVGRVVGLDLNPQYIEQAQARYERRISGTFAQEHSRTTVSTGGKRFCITEFRLGRPKTTPALGREGT